MESKPVLYSFYMSSCSWRLRIALAYKGIEYTLKGLDIQHDEQRSAEYLKINPFGQVPSLVVNGTAFTDSIAILEYLEEAYPTKPLLPTDMVARTRVRQICQIISSGIQPLQSPLVAERYSGDKKKQAEWLHYYINKGFAGLEKVLQETAGKYCVHDSLSLADLCLVPQVFNAEKRFKVDLTPYPTIVRIYETLLGLDCVQISHPFKDPGCPIEYAESPDMDS